MIWFQPNVKLLIMVERNEDVRLAESPCPIALIAVEPTLLGRVASKNGLGSRSRIVPVAQTHGFPVGEMVVNPCSRLVAPLIG